MIVPKDDSQLEERITVRIFPEMMNVIHQQMNLRKGRWENESHFARSAIAHFLNYLETEVIEEEVRS